MIKYLGSKRRLVPVIAALASGCGARTAADLFTGTTRVAQALKALGIHVTAIDTATYSEIFARTYIATDGGSVERAELEAAVRALDALLPAPGYFTDAFCLDARYLHPSNGGRVDAVRDAIEERYSGSELYPLLLTSLIEAADRVDSTTGVQMAYLKQWAPRALQPMRMRAPDLLCGAGAALLGDASELASRIGPVDFAYLDPPYNQHRYYTNYHVWETLVRWDAPAHYGVACKRVDARDHESRSAFNSRRTMPGALAKVVSDIDAKVVAVSCNDESWISRDELVELCSARGHVEILEFGSQRYVGAKIGIYSPLGEAVGEISHLRNVERIAVCGDRREVDAAISGASALAPLPR